MLELKQVNKRYAKQLKLDLSLLYTLKQRHGLWLKIILKMCQCLLRSEFRLTSKQHKISKYGTEKSNRWNGWIKKQFCSGTEFISSTWQNQLPSCFWFWSRYHKSSLPYRNSEMKICKFSFHLRIFYHQSIRMKNRKNVLKVVYLLQKFIQVVRF